ncbi:MAG TPA: hypothetical protein VG269_03330 [Tepidisphaeraceae bacterium]|jgi:hypothetical protein|nr:hypothetical protein [Tepidisphaeraceae bacterium]
MRDGVHDRRGEGMKNRRLSALLSASSLLLFLITCAMWVRSYAVSDTFGWAGWRDEHAGVWGGRGIYFPAGMFAAYSFRGTLIFDDLHQVPGAGIAGMRPHLLHHTEPVTAYHQNRFRWETLSMGSGVMSFTIVALPLWVPAVAFAILPAWRGIVILRRARRPVPGVCRNCNYDLRATPGRCPECGKFSVDLRATT